MNKNVKVVITHNVTYMYNTHTHTYLPGVYFLDRFIPSDCIIYNSVKAVSLCCTNSYAPYMYMHVTATVLVVI